ncbi:MAG: hypothetical protein MUC35_05995 [Candidatus Margulisbacteria bacterium]|nr:hypothetical protein [Candidatus Margulisiibacteriota bacterium]
MTNQLADSNKCPGRQNLGERRRATDEAAERCLDMLHSPVQGDTKAAQNAVQRTDRNGQPKVGAAAQGSTMPDLIQGKVRQWFNTATISLLK